MQGLWQGVYGHVYNNAKVKPNDETTNEADEKVVAVEGK
jgi:hypothetical protein